LSVRVTSAQIKDSTKFKGFHNSIENLHSYQTPLSQLHARRYGEQDLLALCFLSQEVSPTTRRITPKWYDQARKEGIL